MSDNLDLVTFGCRLNLYESEAMRTLAQQAGMTSAVIINTCAVTAEAERQAKQAIRKARRAHPGALVIVTGCAAQINPEKYAALPEVDFVVGNEAKMKAETFVRMAQLAPSLRAQRSNPGPQENNDEVGWGKIITGDMALMREAPTPLVSSFAGGLTRGFVEVQNGCDHRCTYCIIPYGRGASRSVPLETIVQQVRLLLAQGYPEIALTGVDITSYGADLPGQPNLGLMIKRLLMQVPELKRLRLSSLDPKEIDPDLWRLIEREERVMPHLHLSLQSGDDMILKRMKRRHSRQDLYDFVARARAARPEITFGADIIAGFPTEDDAMAAHTYALLEELDFTWLHVFPYSARQGTPAAKMPMVPSAVRKARAARLRALGERAVHKHIEGLVGRRLAVHVEQPTLARAPSFAEVKLSSPEAVGSVILVEGVAREGSRLLARKVE